MKQSAPVNSLFSTSSTLIKILHQSGSIPDFSFRLF